MFLSVITRTFNGRPSSLARCQQSVSNQYLSSRLIQHYLAIDSERRGVEWSHTNLATIEPELSGEYVMLLDDDDYFVRDFAWDLRELVCAQNFPDVVMARMEMEDGRILPIWEVPPYTGGVAVSNYIVRRDVFKEHVVNFTPTYDGDAEFIKAVWNCGHRFYWWDRLIAKVERVSHGQPESLDYSTLGLSA